MRRIPLLAMLTASITLIAALVQAAPASAHGTAAALVRTDTGPVRGTVTGDHREFLGIPYGAPPVGSLRWASPAAPAPWSAPRDATTPGPRCSQLQLPPYLAGQS